MLDGRGVSADVGVVLSLTHFYVVLWDLTVSPHRSGVPRTQGADPPPLLKQKLTWHPINQSPATDELSFIREVRSNVCVVSKTNIWFQTSVLLSHVCIFPQRRVFAGFFSLLFFIKCPGSFYGAFSLFLFRTVVFRFGGMTH